VNGIVLGHSPWIPEGSYTVAYTHYETTKSWNGCKLMAYFSVMDGEYAGTPLTRYYNVDALLSPPGRDGGFQVSDRRLLVREYRVLLPDMASQSTVDLATLKGKRIRADVVTVDRDGLKRELSQVSRYSKIKRLIEIILDDDGELLADPKLG